MLWLACALVCLPAVAVAAEPIDPQTLLRGAALMRELDQPVTVSREKVGLRELLERLQADRRIAIVLDRRIDPGRPIDARLPPSTLRSALEVIAAQAGAVVRLIGDTVVIGPDDNLGLLRTICVLRGLEIDAMGEAVARRKFELARTYTFAWDDLDRPADLIERVTHDAGLNLDGLELVPHDLWGRGAAVEMTATEALSWVLVQYGLTFEWTGTAAGIRIVPLRGPVVVTREHTVSGRGADDVLQRARDRFPDLEMRVEGRKLVATGLIEEHDDIAALARGEDPDAKPKAVSLGPLINRRFTLRVVRQPAGAIFKSLQENGVEMVVDRPALTAAGVDIARKISIDVKQATIDELMAAICEPLETTYQVVGETVHVPAP